MKPILILAISFMLGMAVTDSPAQTSKGMWITGGSLLLDTDVRMGEAVNDVFIQPELGYVFFDRWSLIGQLQLELVNQFSFVSHSLSARYAAFRYQQMEGFLGLSYFRGEGRFLEPGTNNVVRGNLSLGPQAGMLFFFNQYTALEFKLTYPVYSERLIGRNGRRYNGQMFADLKWRYFFHSNLPKDSIRLQFDMPRKSWLVSGTVTLGRKEQAQFPTATDFNRVSAQVGHLLTKRLLVGSGITYANDQDMADFIFGASPYLRYYLFPKKKRVFFGEINGTVLFTHQDNEFQNQTKLLQTGGGIAVGWTKWILPRLGFTVATGNQWYRAQDIILLDWFNGQNFYLRIGLDAFLGGI